MLGQRYRNCYINKCAINDITQDSLNNVTYKFYVLLNVTVTLVLCKYKKC